MTKPIQALNLYRHGFEVVGERIAQRIKRSGGAVVVVADDGTTRISGPGTQHAKQLRESPDLVNEYNAAIEIEDIEDDLIHEMKARLWGASQQASA